MNAPPGSAEFEESDEFERLRRRAYGPDADIAGDAAAQVRLAELEAAHRGQPPPFDDVPTGVASPALDRVPVTEPVEQSRSASRSVSQPLCGAVAGHQPAGESVVRPHPAEGPIVKSDAIDGTPAGSWWRRHRWWMIVGAATVALALNVALLAWMSQLLAEGTTPIPADTAKMQPAPDGQEPRNYLLDQDYVVAEDYVLALESVGADADKPEDKHGTLNALGLSADGMRRYQDIGGLRVWSGESRDGTVCLLVAHPDQGLREGIGAEACAPEGLDPVAHLRVCSGCVTPPGVFAGLPGGSVIRFALTGDHIHVDVFTRATNPNPSQG